MSRIKLDLILVCTVTSVARVRTPAFAAAAASACHPPSRLLAAAAPEQNPPQPPPACAFAGAGRTCDGVGSCVGICVGVGERARIWGRECVHVCMCARLCVYVGSVGYLASTWTSESPSSYEMSSFPVCAGACVCVSEGRLGLYV